MYTIFVCIWLGTEKNLTMLINFDLKYGELVRMVVVIGAIGQATRLPKVKIIILF